MTTQTAPNGSWKGLQTQLREEPSGERFPFYPIKDVPDGKTVNLEIIGGPYFEGLHGQYSLVELDVQDINKDSFRLCVSGSRLAKAIAAVEPEKGDVLQITPTGNGKDRKWRAVC